MSNNSKPIGNRFSENSVKLLNDIINKFEKYSKDRFQDAYYDDLLPLGRTKFTEEFLQQIFNMMFAFIEKTNDRNEKILDFHYPDEVKSIVNFQIQKEPKNLKDILQDCQIVFKYAIKTGHPRFFNQISQGLDIISLAGEWITATTNTNMFTYEIAPIYNLMEETILIKMRKCIGWGEPGDGLFNPGGSISNLYAVQTAKHYFFPQTKYDGLFGMPKLVIFTSEHSHYSMNRAAAILGLGLNQVKSVPVDERGKLIPDVLEKMIIESKSKNEVPFMVALTAGTTVLGAFDPILPVADICEKYKLWLHVDAAWGGGVLLSEKHRNLMRGVERADSVTWNPHKLMGSLLQASAFLVKKQGLLLSSNEMSATYLFQQDKHYDVNYDTGDKTIQCGRHVDILKVWLMWRAKGDDGFEKQIDKLMDLAEYLYNQLEKQPNFDIVHRDPEFTNICFWYVPDSIKSMDKTTLDYKKALHKVAPKIKEKMMTEGTLMISYQPLDDKPNFFRMIISNAATEKGDIDFMLNEIERLGKDL